MNDRLADLASFVTSNNEINDKSILRDLVVDKFDLVRDRSVFYCSGFAVRFSSANSPNFSNTVLSLSNLQKFDDRPFVVCIITPRANHLLLANTTLLKKISHSSQELRVDNIRGSFNGSDIARELNGIANTADNLSRLFEIHLELGFDGNLARLVEATNNISPSGHKFMVTEANRVTILDAPLRALEFINSSDFSTLQSELDVNVKKFRNEILLAALIENVNLRGRVIEYLVTGADLVLRDALIDALRAKEPQGLPEFKTENSLGDYQRIFDDFHTETDVKTKVMALNSNPKAYNIDKMLEFLSHPKSVFLFYLIGVDPGSVVKPTLVSIFNKKLLQATITLKHWAGRNSRGVTQFEGAVIGDLIKYSDNEIDETLANEFLHRLIEL